MKNHKFADTCKNAMGTVFLLAGAFFVCSTFLSIRAVFADPIAPELLTTQAQRATTGSARNSGATSRGSGNTISRTTTATTTASNPSRSVTSRAVVSRGTTATSGASNVARTTSSTSTARPAAASNTSSRGVTSRAVVSRGTATGSASRTTANNTARTVVSRTTTGTNPSRISLQGSAIRGSKATTNTYTYLSNKLYTGNYSNIIDSTTGLISADAYNNCMESYYACMDEICTARNAAQRRCACAGRVKAFAEAEDALEASNEELIKVSGELALLIATNGKDVSAAFQLTDAEKVMNCVSWKEMYEQYQGGTTKDSNGNDLGTVWCQNHGIYDSTKCSATKSPSYCSESGNNFGFNIDSLELSGSDILASLKSWADAKDQTLTITTNDDNKLTSALESITGVVDGLTGISGSLFSYEDTTDSLAETWGYDLFEYAHNNVCSRVLDSCFNGIYEACGTPPNGGKCADGRNTSCPYNYNSKISVTSSGEVALNERSTTGTNTSTASCFGYTTTSGDPYSSLRGPVADARRSIMQKYLLDANADCDLYGEQLRTAAQNVSYQKVAAQQALQQKRLEFAQQDEEERLTNYASARNNFYNCISELYDCYTTQEKSNPTWSTSRIKTYCAQVSNVPSCYDTMVCGPSGNLEAVIELADNSSCKLTDDMATNTCRNVVSLSEILGDSYASGYDSTQACNTQTSTDGAKTCKSALLREECLQVYGIEGVRNWSSSNSGTNWSGVSCPSGQHAENNSCVPDTKSCAHSDPNSETARQVWNSVSQSWSGCQIVTCKAGYNLQNGLCIQGN